MSGIVQHQRTRIAAALRSILRAATGRDINTDELNMRTSEYLVSPRIRGLGSSDSTADSSPLFIASDYAPTSSNDPLGGSDGRDISRGWAAVREDLDTVDEALSEAERRITQSLNAIRSQGALLSTKLNGLLLDASSLQTQSEQLFFGGNGGDGASGRGAISWSVDSDGLVFPQTTGVVLPGGVCCLPNQGQSINTGTNDSGATISPISLTDSTDPVMLASSDTRAWAEQPLNSNAQAWSFTCTSNKPTYVKFKTISNQGISAIQIQCSAGVSVVGLNNTNNGSKISYTTLSVGNYIWLILNTPLLSGVEAQISFSGTQQNNSTYIGSISNMTVYTFDLDSECNFVWGPFQSQAENPDSVYTVSIDDIISALPAGVGIDWQVSTVSADGPWASLPQDGTPLLITSSGREELDLLASDAIPDSVTLGYYNFNLSSVGSLTAGVFTAGNEQCKVDAFLYDWSTQNDPTHKSSPKDWVSPQGVIRTVAMGASTEVYFGQLNQQRYPSTAYTQQGTPFSRYLDDQGRDLVYINLKGGDNSWTLSPGYNYRFTFSIYTPNGAYLPDLPVGIINPSTAALPGVLGVPILVQLNGTTVFQGSNVFTNYLELSPAASTFGTNPSDYPTVGQGSGWPPYCGRMTLNCLPGWNTLTLYTTIPSPGPGSTSNPSYTSISNNLQPWAGIVFGPSLFADPSTRYQNTGIQTLQGWPKPWTQLSEFDLRVNTPIGMQEVWAWKVDPNDGTIQGILLNHNPAISETGFVTLDNVLSGQARNHHISYLTQTNGSTQSIVPGQDPLSTNLWVRARFSSSSSTTGPLLTSFRLQVN